MDMKKFAGSRFLKVADVERGRRVEKIVAVSEGKYEKPNLEFESGDLLSLNATNVKTLIRAYGEDSRDWLGCDVELYAGEVEYQGSKTDSVLVKPISPQKETPGAKAEPLDDEVPF